MSPRNIALVPSPRFHLPTTEERKGEGGDEVATTPAIPSIILAGTPQERRGAAGARQTSPFGKYSLFLHFRSVPFRSTLYFCSKYPSLPSLLSFSLSLSPARISKPNLLTLFYSIVPALHYNRHQGEKGGHWNFLTSGDGSSK